jgi:hypothetical protein
MYEVNESIVALVYTAITHAGYMYVLYGTSNATG